MTKEQIQALIDAKIAGQGSAVDVGGALPAILSEILNLATAQPPAPTDMAKVLVIPNYSGIDIEEESKAEFCEAAGITEEQFDSLLSGEYAFVKCPNRKDIEKVFLTPVYSGGDKIWFKMIDNADIDSTENITIVQFQISDGLYRLLEY